MLSHQDPARPEPRRPPSLPPEVEALLHLGEQLLAQPGDVGVAMWDGWAGSLQSTFRSPDPEDLPALITADELLDQIRTGDCPAGVLAAATMAVYGPGRIKQAARHVVSELMNDGAVLPPSVAEIGAVRPIEAMLLGDVWGDQHTLVLDCERADGTREGSKVAITSSDGIRAMTFIHGPTIGICRRDAFHSEFAVAIHIDLADARALFELASSNYDPYASPMPRPFLKPDVDPVARFGSGPVEVSIREVDPSIDHRAGTNGAFAGGNEPIGRPPVRRPPSLLDGQAGSCAAFDQAGGGPSVEDLVLGALRDADERDRLHLTVEIAEADRAIVEHRFGLLPLGGRSPLPALDDASVLHPDLLTVEFAASGWPTGALGPNDGLGTLSLHDFVESVCRFASLWDGDPLRWGPDRVRNYLVAELFIHGRSSTRSEVLPPLLKAWLGFSAGRRGVPPRALAVSQRTVDLVVKDVKERRPRS